MNRRKFLRATTGLAVLAAPALVPGRPSAGNNRQPMKAAVIGHTGFGRYGHGHEFVFMNRPGIETVAVADPVESGRKKVQEAIGAPRGYADYREMLERERPNLVMVALRWTEERRAMVTAALDVGAHVITEKPFTHSLEDADAMVAHAKRVRRKLAVTHPMRVAPSTAFLKRRLDKGLLGELLSIRVHGEGRFRSGGEDLLVFGAHLFDLLRYLIGDATEVKARILHQGRDITRADARRGDYDKEIGPVAGDDIEAWFKMGRNLNVHYTSKRDSVPPSGYYSLEFHGTKGAVRMKGGFEPVLTLQHGGQWRPIDGDPGRTLSPEDTGRHAANRRMMDDWLAAIAEDREPISSGYDGMKFVEMVQGVYAAGLSRQTIAFPLQDRRHPLLG